ncbi:MAG: IS110 family transposase [Planctomycetota bacterium]|nr:IS110 family transposase [Planctomycetota bacterium]
MHFIGTDLHKKTITMHVVDQARRTVAAQRLDCSDTEGITTWLAQFRPFQLVVEATASYEWFVQLVEPLAERVVLAHPGKLRVIAESTRKSDQVDAKVLAEFLALDMIPPAYRPTPRQRAHRRRVRYRYSLVCRMTALKNRIRRILSDYNADCPDLFSRRARLAKRQMPSKLSATDQWVLEQLWLEYDFQQERMTAADQGLREFAASAPVPEAQARALLRTIPGVGEVTVEAFLSEIGDVRRFGSQKQVVAYAGLAPGQRESAGKTKELGISHRGSRIVRWALNQASWQLVRRDLRWRRIFEGLAKRRGKKKAITAISRRLLCVMVSLVVSGQGYHLAAA